MAEKLPLWATVQFSLEHYDICSNGEATSMKKKRVWYRWIESDYALVSHMYMPLQHRHAKQVDSLFHILGLSQLFFCCTVFFVFFGGNVLKTKPGSAPVFAVSLYHLLKTKKGVFSRSGSTEGTHCGLMAHHWPWHFSFAACQHVRGRGDCFLTQMVFFSSGSWK